MTTRAGSSTGCSKKRLCLPSPAKRPCARWSPVADRVSDWRFSLAPEPILLTQLRDMANGYLYAGQEGSTDQVDENDLAAQSAAATIADLAGLAGREQVGILASPYTGADLGLLAMDGWRDGLEAVQMGKQELQTSLGLESPLLGAFACDTNVTADSLAYYADASIEHVVVGCSVLGALAETQAPNTLSLRVENDDNDRVTMVFASEAMSAVMKAPWDVDVFGAALAAELAGTARAGLVVVPEDAYGPVPPAYLQAVGELLDRPDLDTYSQTGRAGRSAWS